jgi:hypothetical protein
MQEPQMAALFGSAIDVWNRAIREHRDRFPFREVLPKCEVALRGKTLGVQVCEGALRRPVARFAVRFEHGLIRTVSGGTPEAETVWEVSRERLEEVADNPQHFADHPAKLDWDLLTKPLGVSL